MAPPHGASTHNVVKESIATGMSSIFPTRCEKTDVTGYHPDYFLLGFGAEPSHLKMQRLLKGHGWRVCGGVARCSGWWGCEGLGGGRAATATGTAWAGAGPR